MKSESIKAGEYSRQNKSKDRGEGGNFCSRVHTVEGTRAPSRVRPVGAPQGSQVHRNTVSEYKPHDTNHPAYSSVHRPAEPIDHQQLKRHQEDMLTKRQKSKNRAPKGGKG